MTKYSSISPLFSAADAFTITNVDKTSLVRVWEKRDGKTVSRWMPVSKG